MATIKENLEIIKKQINLENTRILAVTKYVGVQEIIQAYEAGIKNLAENKIQDAESKRRSLPQYINDDIIWHFIGHLQTNKVKKTVGNYEYIHSVDTLKLAEAISNQAQKINKVQNILLQVNVTEEESKSGFDKVGLETNFMQITSLANIKVKGLMTIGILSNDEKFLRETFKKLFSFRNYLQEKFNHSLPELSMGMSNDYKIAVEEGSTMVRIGQALFK